MIVQYAFICSTLLYIIIQTTSNGGIEGSIESEVLLDVRDMHTSLSIQDVQRCVVITQQEHR
jgi:hypothetical protein